MNSNWRKLALLGGEPLVKEEFPKWPEIDKTDVDSVVHTLLHEELSAYEVIDGPLFNFEKELRERFNVNYALLVGSGTAALQSAAFALNIGPGDEIIVPTITFPGTASVFLHFGATVRFVDVDPVTGNPSVETILNSVTSSTKAVVVAHAWGIPVEVDRLYTNLSSKGIYLIEDSARALGSQCNGIGIGTIGDIGCFSFHELKTIPAGEGGLVLTNNREFYERAVAYGHYFRSKEKMHLSTSPLAKYHDTGLGLNLKIHPLAASLARSQFKRLDIRLANMETNHNLFDTYLNGSKYYKSQKKPEWANRISYYGFNFLWDPDENGINVSLDTLIKAFRAEGVHASLIGNPPLFQMNLFKDSVTEGPLPGKVVGSIDDSNYPGSIKHASMLCRFPNIVNENPKWINYYLDVLEKVAINLELLSKWQNSYGGSI